MKTFEDFKIQVAKENGMNKLVTGHAVALFDEASERYANYKAEIAFNEGCEAAMDSYGYCKPIVNPYKTTKDDKI